ncbi:hypothetical protein BH24BAC1_BH24BAC1_23060 [soil metagenome]
MKKAIVIGGTGLVGSHLVRLLLQDERFETVKVFVGRSTGLSHYKLEEYLVDFDQPQEWRLLVKGSVLFSALGSTFKQAGSRNAQYKIDYTYQYQFAEAAAKNGVGIYVLLSASNASVDSVVFYARMKAALEEEVKKLPFLNIHILRPGPMEGSQETEEPLEKVYAFFVKGLNKIGLFKSLRPISGKAVAKAMINASFLNNDRMEVYPLHSIFSLAQRGNS